MTVIPPDPSRRVFLRTAAAGAIVHKRFNREKIGKGFALEFLFDKVRADRGTEYYDGYFVIDADNLLDCRYIEEMNKALPTAMSGRPAVLKKREQVKQIDKILEER